MIEDFIFLLVVECLQSLNPTCTRQNHDSSYLRAFETNKTVSISVQPDDFATFIFQTII